jgi:hypothetical protein
LATTNYVGNNFLNEASSSLSIEEQNELDALDMVIGLSREEKSYLLSVWRSSPTMPSLVRTDDRRAINVMHGKIADEGSEST